MQYIQQGGGLYGIYTTERVKPEVKGVTANRKSQTNMHYVLYSPQPDLSLLLVYMTIIQNYILESHVTCGTDTNSHVTCNEKLFFINCM